MVARIDLIIDARDTAVLVDQKTHSLGRWSFAIGACAVCERGFPRRVGEQRETEFVVMRECGVRFGSVETDAQDLDLVLVVVALMVAEAASFDGASGSARGGIKPQQDFSSAQVRARNDPAVVSGKRKFRRAISNLEHRGSPARRP